VFGFLLIASLLPIRIIDYYGLHRVPRARVAEVLAIHEGDPLPDSKEAVEQRLGKIPGVRAV